MTECGIDEDYSSFASCDVDGACGVHAAEGLAEHAWMAGASGRNPYGPMSEEDKQDIRDAGRGHLLCD